MIYTLPNDYFVRALTEEDLSGPYPSWFEDQEVCKYNSHGKWVKNSNWFRTFYEDMNREDQLVWAVCHKRDGHIGNISLQGISFIDRNAELAIVIGARDHWRKSVGFEASKVLLKHGFYKLNLERVYCGTAATNLGMQKLAQQLGMIEEGRRRRHLYLEGQWVDMLEYGVLKEEFVQSHPFDQ